MSVSIPQIQDKKHRVCSNCRFKKVKCTGGDPCETCKKEDKICIVYAPLEDQRGTMIRQGCLNGYTMTQSMLHTALVDLIQKRKIPDVPAEALSSPHALLSAMGMIDEKDNAAWKDNFERPWAYTVSNLATTHPKDKKPHAPRGPNKAGPNKAGPNKADEETAAARKQRKQAVRRQQQPTCPDTPAPGYSVAAQNPGWYNAAAVAPAQQQLGYNQLPVGQAYGHTVESTFNSALPSAAFPPAPGQFDGHPYNQGNPFLAPLSFPSLNTPGYGLLPAYADPQPAQWQPQQWQQQHQQQQQPAATPAPVPAPGPAMPAAGSPAPASDAPVTDFDDLFPELPGGNGSYDIDDLFLDGQTINQVVGVDPPGAVPDAEMALNGGGEEQAPAQFTGPGEGVDQEDFEMGMDLIDWNAVN